MKEQLLTIHLNDKKTIGVFVPDDRSVSSLIIEMIDRKDEINNISLDLLEGLNFKNKIEVEEDKKEKKKLVGSISNESEVKYVSKGQENSSILDSIKQFRKELSNLNRQNGLEEISENKENKEENAEYDNELEKSGNINEHNIIYLKLFNKSFSNEEQDLILKTLDTKINAKILFEKTKEKLGLDKIEKIYEKTIDVSKTKFIKGSLRSGIREEFKGSVVLLGDLNNGAEIIAEDNVVILGELRGLAHAGANGNAKAFVAANSTKKTQIRIGKEVQEVEKYDKFPIFFIEDGKITVDYKSNNTIEIQNEDKKKNKWRF